MNDSTHLQRMIAARTRAHTRGARAESVSVEAADEAAPPHTDDVLERVNTVMRAMPGEEVVDPSEFRRALSIFLAQTDRTLRKLDADPRAALDRNELLTMEAVIRTDGTRPTLLVRKNTINPDHPLAGSWRDSLVGVLGKVEPRAAAIGRVEPDSGSALRFFGTGWLVDADKGLVLTNLHVLEAMLRSIPNAMIQTKSGFRVLKRGAYIDFAAEDGSLERRRFRIVEATPSGIDGPGFSRLDIAVLKIEEAGADEGGGAKLPRPIPVIADVGGAQGAMSSFCVIGFPGRPDVLSGVVDGVDWDWVTKTLFGNRFGVKRLAPGNAHRPVGTLGGDPRQWVFGHDATTLGGSSGSPVLAWKDSHFGSFGIHFAGATVDTNCAHAIAQCRAELTKLGIAVQDAP
jgi:hypothetical protein